MTQTAVPRDSRRRSLLKAISYRVLGSLVTGALAWFVTGDLQVAFAIGTLEPIVKMALYYAHERVWLQVPDRWLGQR